MSVVAALPTYEGIETEEERSGCTFKGNINAANSVYYTVQVDVDLCDEETKTLTMEDATTEIVAVSTYEACREVKCGVPGRKTVYYVFVPFLDGYARVYFDAELLSINGMDEDSWLELTDILEKSASIELLNEKTMTKDGRLYDSTQTMAFKNPATIAGQEVELTHSVKSTGLAVCASVTVDGIEHSIYTKGTIPEEQFNSKVENEEVYTAYKKSGDMYYCNMTNRLPDVGCEVLVELDGVYYNFFIERYHNLDVKQNRDFLDDTSNCEIFAELAADFVSNAKINTDGYGEQA